MDCLALGITSTKIISNLYLIIYVGSSIPFSLSKCGKSRWPSFSSRYNSSGRSRSIIMKTPSLCFSLSKSRMWIIKEHNHPLISSRDAHPAVLNKREIMNERIRYDKQICRQMMHYNILDERWCSGDLSSCYRLLVHCWMSLIGHKMTRQRNTAFVPW